MFGAVDLYGGDCRGCGGCCGRMAELARGAVVPHVR